MMTETGFMLVDYLVLGLSLSFAILTGVYFAIKDRKSESTFLYFHGNGNMQPLAVGMSLGVSCVSALSILGYPIEFYVYGSVWFWIMVSVPLIVWTVCAYFVPVYYELQIKCLYEYLEMRYNKRMRLFGSFLGMSYLFLYMAVAVYYPALAVTAVMPISVEWSIFVTVSFCTFYTVIGGFKSVVWTDTLQSIVMVAGCIVFFILLTIRVGGIENVLTANIRGNRTNFFDFSLDPFKRNTSWGVLSVMYFSWMEVMVGNQSYVQRWISCKSVSSANRAMYASMVPILIVYAFTLLIGMVMYALYEDCDPLANGEINIRDEMLVYTLAKITRMLPGISGLFVACVYSGTLSTVSSGINSLSVIILEDFVGLKWRIDDGAKKLKYSKICGLIVGLIILAMSYLVSFLNGTIVEIGMLTLSCFGSCIVGILILGVFFPWTNSIGAFIGAGCGFIVNLALTMGSLFTEHPSQALPVSVDGCNSTLVGNITSSVQNNNYENDIFDISFTHTRFISIAITIPLGVLASFLSGANDPKTMNPKLFRPLIDNKMLPAGIRRFFRFGVPEIDRSDVKTNSRMKVEEIHLVPSPSNQSLLKTNA